MFFWETTLPKLVKYAYICRSPFRSTIKFVSQSSNAARSKDVMAEEIFYAPIPKSRYVLVYLGAATQLIFWGNLAQWAGTAYVIKDP